MAEMSSAKRALLDTFGERVKAMRRELKLTQQDLAGLMHAPRTWVSDLENAGQRGIAAETVVRFAKALGVSTDYLLGLVDVPMSVPIRHGRLRQGGAWAGKVWTSPDFDDMDEDLIRLFEGEDDDAAPR